MEIVKIILMEHTTNYVQEQPLQNSYTGCIHCPWMRIHGGRYLRTKLLMHKVDTNTHVSSTFLLLAIEYLYLCSIRTHNK